MRSHPNAITDFDCDANPGKEEEMERAFGLKADNETFGFTVWRLAKYIQDDFQDLGEAVFDRATGLMWQKSDSGEILTYEDARTYCENLKLADKNKLAVADSGRANLFIGGEREFGWLLHKFYI